MTVPDRTNRQADRLPAVSSSAMSAFHDAIRQQMEESRKRDQLRQTMHMMDPVINADPVEWIENNFYIPETGRPMELYPAQREPLVEALRRDEHGKFIYSTVLWGAIKKSAKSSIAAAVAMWFAFRRPYSSIKVLGNDLKQAESRTYEYARRGVLLREDWKSTIQVNNYKMTLPNRSMIEAIPVDPTGEAGGNDDLLVYTELWGWKSTKHQQMWSESTLSPTKYGESIRWCETYAGFTGESPVLEQLYRAGVLDGEVFNAEREMYRNGRSRIFALWMTRPSLPWQTPDYYAQESATLAPSEFRRLHRNEWVSSEESFLEDMVMWDLCSGDVPPLEPNEPVVVAIDAAVSNDCFAAVTVSRREEQLYLRECRIWTPPPGGRIDFDEPRAYLRDLGTRYNVYQYAYDPSQMHDMATGLQREGVGWFRPFQQGQERIVGDKHLYDLIRGRRFHHDGLHHALREHVANANRKEDGDKLRIIKRADHLKIDACVALAMACAEARRLNVG